MSDTSNAFGFGKLVPGFDFLQSLAKGASGAMPQLPSLSSWVAPTLSVEELEKRVGELKAVQFWLEQNSRALAATIQALEVQKMTLATLHGMNVSMSDLANAFKLQPGAAGAGDAAPAPFAAPASAQPRDARAGAKESAGDTAQADARANNGAHAKPSAKRAGGDTGSAAAAPIVDPMQWWGALTGQFQQIAANALKDAHQGGMDATASVATGFAKDALKTASDMANQFAGKGSGGSGARKRAAAAPGAPAAASSSSTKGAAKKAARTAAAKPTAAPARSAARKRQG